MDFEVIIIGGGPAGLTAAAELVKAKRRVLLLERESFGGQVGNLEWIENYPTPGERIEGPRLANTLVEAAAGVKMGLGEVIEVESYSGCRSVTCADGKAYTAPVLIIAGGIKPRPLGIPGEEKYQGKGMIHCAFCDGGLYANKVVAVCGGGDAGIMQALYLSKFASLVRVIEVQAQLSASTNLQASARANSKLDIRLACRPVAIVGGDFVAGIEVEPASGGLKEFLNVHGILVHAGFDPASSYLEGVIDLEDLGFIVVDASGATDAEGILAAGDIRQASPRMAAGAVQDGISAASSALKLLEGARVQGGG
ncbi:MAG: FAD-dependent oxidoreductase [Betaproteobacteria bacterium]|nr:FAD-dependent oxidoreductase [Betaproteobacteria bacterium]